jgi:hypothetical protein
VFGIAKCSRGAEDVLLKREFRREFKRDDDDADDDSDDQTTTRREFMEPTVSTKAKISTVLPSWEK